MKPEWTTIEQARTFLRQTFAPTPLLPAPMLRTDKSHPAYLKIENGLPTGSFKVRGALFALHAEMGWRPVKEVVAASNRGDEACGLDLPHGLDCLSYIAHAT